ncbi:MAG: SMR family transporter [Hyphomicrobiaceae bacterium]
MRKVIILGFLLLLAIDTTAHVFVKLASNRIGEFGEPEWLDRLLREPYVLGVIVCYLAAFVTYTNLLKHAPVGPAYAAVHGYVVTVLIVSIAFFGESLTLLQAAGCLLIVAGIIVLGVTEELEQPSQSPANAPD